MEVASSRQRLYRSLALRVTLLTTALFFFHPAISAQSNRNDKSQKGPRAIALVQIQSDGKGRLFPIAILDNGKFFDAAIYKGKPIPMAVDPGTVYEGLKGGVSQGLFTITGAGQMSGSWIGEGTWLAAGATPPRKGMKAEMPVIKDDSDAPPTLKRPDASTKTDDKSARTKESRQKQDKAESAPDQSKNSASEKPAESKPVGPEPSTSDDPNRPVLRRGAPEPKRAAEEKPQSTSAGSNPNPKGGKRAAPLVLVAVSDAAGADPRPYNFGAKPDEVEKYLKLMLDLAAQDVQRRIDDLSAATASATGAAPPARKTAATSTKKLHPKFTDIDFHVFDLSNANEPVWVLTAKTELPSTKPTSTETPASAEYFVTMVCRTDIYGDLRKLLSQVTDAKHLDVLSRLELVDAVDADGDGRGELLFREISTNDNRGYVLYRFTGDTLWKLFDSFGGE